MLHGPRRQPRVARRVLHACKQVRQLQRQHLRNVARAARRRTREHVHNHTTQAVNVAAVAHVSLPLLWRRKPVCARRAKHRLNAPRAGIACAAEVTEHCAADSARQIVAGVDRKVSDVQLVMQTHEVACQRSAACVASSALSLPLTLPATLSTSRLCSAPCPYRSDQHAAIACEARSL